MRGPDPTFGVAALFVLLACLMAIVGAYEGAFAPEGFVHHWQELIAGCFALGAAVIGGRYVTRQIEQADRLEAARNRRLVAAARATLPMSLSAITGYAQTCGDFLRQVLDLAQGERIPDDAKIPALPKLPTGIVAEFKEFISVCDGTASDSLADIVSLLQVQYVRIQEVPENLARTGHIVVRTNIEAYVVDTAELYARASALFDYARRESESSECLEEDSIVKALNLLRFRQDDYARIHEDGRRRALRLLSKSKPLDTAT